MRQPESVGINDSSICATFARALGVGIPYSSAGLPIFEILQNSNHNEFLYDLLQTHFMFLNQIQTMTEALANINSNLPRVQIE